ncbi:GTPase RsgA, partial [Micromonospora phytophila]|uniref:GTPase RsgA n=1 Tax=Micromonospora phytophila TaxID=709888 RepID=UPI00202DE598
MRIDLTALGWDADRAIDARRRTDHRPGRVARVDRGVCTVLCADGPVRATLGGAVLAAAAPDLTRLPCAGDWVLLATWPDRNVTVEAVLPRRTALVRRTAGKDASGQVLAANLDAAAVVEPVHPEPDIGRIERLPSLAHESGARPLVVLTKADLAADPAAVARQLAAVAPGVP